MPDEPTEPPKQTWDVYRGPEHLGSFEAPEGTDPEVALELADKSFPGIIVEPSMRLALRKTERKE